MSYGLSALTNTGLMSLRSSSAVEIRAAATQARRDGATDVSLTKDGKTITEADLGKLTALVLQESTMTRYA